MTQLYDQSPPNMSDIKLNLGAIITLDYWQAEEHDEEYLFQVTQLVQTSSRVLLLALLFSESGLEVACLRVFFAA